MRKLSRSHRVWLEAFSAWCCLHVGTLLLNEGEDRSRCGNGWRANPVRRGVPAHSCQLRLQSAPASPGRVRVCGVLRRTLRHPGQNSPAFLENAGAPACCPATSRRLQGASQGASQMRPSTPGRGRARSMVLRAPSASPRASCPMKARPSTCIGQAAWQKGCSS